MSSTRTIRFSVNSQVPWKAFRDEVTGLWIGVCEALGVTAHAQDWNELMSVSREIQQALFFDLLQNGELPSFLSQHGWTPIDEIPYGAVDEDFNFDMPNVFDVVTGVPAYQAAQALGNARS